MPGIRWRDKVYEGLDQADILLVYWTKHAAGSEWVRKEYEYFHSHYPDRLMMPIKGDETSLSALLEEYQYSDFSPLINELLALKRQMQRQGAKQPQIQAAILARVNEAGIEIKPEDRARLLKLFAPTGLLALLSTPLMFFQWVADTGLEAAAQLSSAQAVLVGAAAVGGAVVCHVVNQINAPNLEPHSVEASRQTNREQATPSGTSRVESQIAPSRQNGTNERVNECGGQVVDGACCGGSAWVKIGRCGVGFARNWNCEKALQEGTPQYRAYICGQLEEQNKVCPEVAEYCTNN